MNETSRQKARAWAYPRHKHFVQILRDAASTWFETCGFSGLKTSYILPAREQWKQNIILEEVWTYIESERKTRLDANKGFPLHKYVHHGLSSQAMAFNLLGPLVIKNDLEPLYRAVKAKGLAWPKDDLEPQFEYEDREIFNEDTRQPTSLDFVLRASGRPVVCIEVKLAETAFGGCSVFIGGDCDGRNPARDISACYLHHIGRRYWELMEKHGFIDEALLSERICPMTIQYQFFREILFAIENDGIFILLCDGRSPAFMIDGPQGKRGILSMLLSYVPENLRSRVGIVTVSDVVLEIEKTGRHKWIDMFKKRYAIT